MKINFAHINEQGHNCAIFDANATNDTDTGRAQLLNQLVILAKREGLGIDRAVLAYSQHGGIRFYGHRDLAQFLVSLVENGGSFPWTHELTL